MSESTLANNQQMSAIVPSRGLLAGLCNCGRRPGRRPPGGGCVTVRDTPIETPDLAIYSQDEQMASGAIPSWDSPDIITNEWGPFRLLQEARIKVRNLSPTTFAANAAVHYFTSPFGIGTRRQLRLTRMVSLAPLQEAELLFPLHQEVLSGDPRTGVHIQIEHPGDSSLLNNRGSQVHDGGYTTESGRDFTVQIPVLNDSGVSREIQLAVLPTDLSSTISPATRVFAPFEQIMATLHIVVPAFLSGSPGSEIHRAVTVMGRVAGSGPVIGGATRLLRINN
jgi:hypothetical protein